MNCFEETKRAVSLLNVSDMRMEHRCWCCSSDSIQLFDAESPKFAFFTFTVPNGRNIFERLVEMRTRRILAIGTALTQPRSTSVNISISPVQAMQSMQSFPSMVAFTPNSTPAPALLGTSVPSSSVELDVLKKHLADTQQQLNMTQEAMRLQQEREQLRREKEELEHMRRQMQTGQRSSACNNLSGGAPTAPATSSSLTMPLVQSEFGSSGTLAPPPSAPMPAPANNPSAV
jgi:hypothetical protein